MVTFADYCKCNVCNNKIYRHEYIVSISNKNVVGNAEDHRLLSRAWCSLLKFNVDRRLMVNVEN